jgi:hypothetical protein
MAKRTWTDGVIGNTPLSAARLNLLEDDLEASMVALAREPEALFSGAVTPDSNGAVTSASVLWPDGVAGVYSGTASATFLGVDDSYTVTRVGTPTKTYTQPLVTRNGSGFITNRPAIPVT